LSPSGNFLWGGFSDGTLRVFDLSGTFALQKSQSDGHSNNNSNGGGSKSGRPFLNSKSHQTYGAVACQIHARGVHTDLITTVDITPDGKYVFCGVSRGAMELYAVNVEALEATVQSQRRFKNKLQQPQGTHQDADQGRHRLNMLDYIHVYCHSDAKLKGFGACTNMNMITSSAGRNNTTAYLLLTGKGIKNIHIWKFTPPTFSTGDGSLSQCEPHGEHIAKEDNGTWDQLYDTSTNGNTILLLNFYRTPQGKLLAVSKSDAQKLRLWDLSFEEHQWQQPTWKRPKRPPYQDVENSHAALGIAGGFCICGGSGMYNELSIVSLDQPNNTYNHSELSLPTSTSDGETSSSRRQRRGEMKAVINVATSPQDSTHALLELDDVSCRWI
jgi:WD40 repeat protein